MSAVVTRNATENATDKTGEKLIDTGTNPVTCSVAGRPQALIVDDSPFLALHLSRLLAAQGLHARVPADPGELRALAPEAAVIFVELELFQGSGFEVTRELAAHCSCPLVLLTGCGRNTDLQWGLRAGASAVLPRPVTDTTLRAVLCKLHCAGGC
jgi:DNA-binding response OmpR family regulator